MAKTIVPSFMASRKDHRHVVQSHPMRLSTITRITQDVEQLTNYYETLLDREPVEHNETIALFDLGTVELFIHETYEPDAHDVPAEDYITFVVSDVDADYRRMTAEGATGILEPAGYPWGQSAYLRDPDGLMIELNDGNSGLD